MTGQSDNTHSITSRLIIATHESFLDTGGLMLESAPRKTPPASKPELEMSKLTSLKKIALALNVEDIRTVKKMAARGDITLKRVGRKFSIALKNVSEGKRIALR